MTNRPFSLVSKSIRTLDLKLDNEKAVTQSIIRAIEKGTADYIMPWHRAQVPINALTKKPYRGINTLSLWATGVNEGFESSQWATYQSWKSAKRQVRKGQKGTRIMFFSRIKIDGEPEDEELPLNYGFRRYFSVFNEEQLEATGEIQPVVDSPVIENTRASYQVVSIAQRANAEVLIEGDRAAYNPSLDRVTMPEKERFFDTRYASADVGFASVLAHELIHWTGHTSRLNRGASLDKKSPSYAFEELVAELGSAFTCTELGIEYNGLDGHAGYIQGWLSLLEDDNKAIFRASSEAMKAKRFLIPDVEESKAETA